jgi:hypothetical protein
VNTPYPDLEMQEFLLLIRLTLVSSKTNA